MLQRNSFDLSSARTAGMLSGARRVAMLLATLLLTMTAQTAWATKVDVTLSVDNDFAEGTAGHYYVNMPPANDQFYWLTLTEADIAAGKGTFKVYDDGGKNGNYSDDKGVYLILTAPDGYVCQLSGSITTETGDCLTVFDGSSTSKLLNSVSSTSDGTETAITTVVSSGNIMRLYFVSNGSKNYAGLDLTVTLINPNAEHNITINNATGGSIASNKSTAKFNDVVTLTASPESGYVLNDLSIVDGSSNTVTVTGGWYTNNAATFTMPASNVTVAPVFTTDLTSLYIYMPRTGTVNATIPAGVTSFKVYDDGGASGNYSYNCDGTLVLIAPTGYLLQLSGNITTDKQHEYLNVYDGNTTSATKLLGPVSSPSNGTAIDITTVTSTANYMTLCFKSDGALNYAGLDLTVTVSVSNVKHSINVNTAEGGSVAASVGGSPAETAYVNDVVKLTASPSNGSLLSDLSVKDANNNAVAVSDMLWYTGNTTATFTMPSSAVTVTPTFTNTLTADGGLYVNMPATGDKTATIPAGVTSFKVYDDGGKNGNYSDKCDGTLVLTAPTGYRLQLSGNIKTERFHDKLTVYDGSTTSGTKLLDAVSSTEGYIQTAITTVTSTGNSMTLCFKSDDGVNHAGLDLTVFASNMEYNINVNTAEGGSVATTVGGANASAAKLNDVVTLTATPSEGYVLSGISVTDASSNAVDIDWSIWTNTATFTMPGSAVTVTPTFTNAKTAADGLNITMIKTGEQTATIPAGVQSFHVDYDYSIKSSGSSKLTITAPEGYLLQLSGTATMTGFDHAYFYVYDGDDVVNDPTLINSSSSGNYTGVVSTGNVMTIYCWTIYNQGKTWDLDLTVNVVTANNYNDVVISNSIANGQVVSDKNTANVTETVTLTATPAEGYVLQSISVTDGAGAISLTPSATDATWGDVSYYTANEFTFKMRSSDATVNATFMAKTDFYVNMPKTDHRDFAIPDGTTSFKVYDNSGKNGRYLTDNNGKLLLTAPEGYVMNVSGYVKLYYSSNDRDYLDIYDGNSTSATSLGRFKDTSGNNNTFTQTPVTATSSTNQMLLHFVTDDSGYVEVGSGVYLTVTLVPVLSETAGITSADAASLQGKMAQFSRTFTASVSSTLCLPFPMTGITGGTAYEFTAMEKVSDVWTATMSAVTSTEAGKPYLFMAGADGAVSFSGTVPNDFTGVAASSAPVAYSGGGTWTFCGTYTTLTYGTNLDGAVYGFAAQSYAANNISPGNFVKAETGAYVPPFRCYLRYTAPSNARGMTRGADIDLPSRIIVRLLGLDGQTTAIGSMDTKTGEVSFDGSDWYTLDGHQLIGKPTQRGIYINNGKKVIVK